MFLDFVIFFLGIDFLEIIMDVYNDVCLKLFIIGWKLFGYLLIGNWLYKLLCIYNIEYLCSYLKYCRFTFIFMEIELFCNVRRNSVCKIM